VRTYELNVISVRYPSGRPTTRLTDKDKRVLGAEAKNLWEDRLIWDLPYNGIRHSAAHGAAHHDAARGRFELP
jgi:hypothetical protein